MDDQNQTQQTPVEPTAPVVDPNVPTGNVDVPGSVPTPPVGEAVPPVEPVAPVAPVEPVVSPTPEVNPVVGQTPEQPVQNTDQNGGVGV